MLADAGGSARCAAGHCFDYARSGYLNLRRPTQGRGRVGDTAAMVRARAEFLAAGHYGPVAAALSTAATEASAEAEVIAEIGSGTGHYLDAVERSLGESGPGPECAFGFDLSRAAADHAAKRHPDLRFVVADVEDAIPLRDSAADLALSVFSPRPGAELARVIRPGGELIVVMAGPRHLERLRERLSLMSIHDDKLDRLTERLAAWFDPGGATAVEYEVDLSRADAQRLVLMGPNAWHGVDPVVLGERFSDLVSVVVARFLRRHTR